MLRPVVTDSLEKFTSTVLEFVGIVIAGMIVALMLSYLLGGKSQVLRQLIFSLASFAGVCFAAYRVIN